MPNINSKQVKEQWLGWEREVLLFLRKKTYTTTYLKIWCKYVCHFCFSSIIGDVADEDLEWRVSWQGPRRPTRGTAETPRRLIGWTLSRGGRKRRKTLHYAK